MEVVANMQNLDWFVYDLQVAFTGQTFTLLQRVGAIVVSSCLDWMV